MRDDILRADARISTKRRNEPLDMKAGRRWYVRRGHQLQDASSSIASASDICRTPREIKII